MASSQTVNGYQPRSETELREVISGGLLEEDHFNDFKREVGVGARSNKALAEDLAAFSIDGGRIYVGVDEDSGRPVLAPLQTTGLCERIEQVGLSRVEPPVYVAATAIASDRSPELGYVIITVPPSPSAPHMVDGRYIGRGDKTNRTIHDAEVIRLHERRQQVARRLDEVLRTEIERDPIPNSDNGHIFIVAEPVNGQPKMLHERVLQTGMEQWIRSDFGPDVASSAGNWEPRIDVSRAVCRRGARGWALRSSGITPGREVEQRTEGSRAESNLLDVEVSEDGGIRVFCGRGTDRHQGVTVVPEGAVIGLLRQVLRGMSSVAGAARYLGSWDVGMAITKLKGAASYELLSRNQPYFIDDWRYSDEMYSAMARVTGEQLAADSIGITRELYGPLSRGLSSSLELAEASAEGKLRL